LPGTRLDLRLDENDVPLPDSQPINRVDEAAYKHDLAYRSENIDDRHKADREMIEAIKSIPNPTLRERIEGAIVIRLMQAKLKLGQGITKEQRQTMSKKQLEKMADEIHKPFKKPNVLLKVKVFHMDDIWSADLIFLPPEHSYKVAITVIDLYTKFAWVRKLKNKTGTEVAKAFEDIMKTSKRKPKKLWVDQGSEFYNQLFKKMLKDNDIDMYSTYNEGKAVVIENFNRTLKSRLFKAFTVNGNQKWVDIIQNIVYDYNNKIHSVIGISPSEATNDPEKIKARVMQNNYQQELDSYNQTKGQRFKVGDRVRICKYKQTFDKGFTGYWTSEVFKIVKVNETVPKTYELRDLNDEEIYGKFYENELQKSDF